MAQMVKMGAIRRSVTSVHMATLPLESQLEKDMWVEEQELQHGSWPKFAPNHVTNTWQNEPRVSVASEAHVPRTRLSHAHICSPFLCNLMNYIIFYYSTNF